MLFRSYNRLIRADRVLDDLQHDVGVLAWAGIQVDKRDLEGLRSGDSCMHEIVEHLQVVRDRITFASYALQPFAAMYDALMKAGASEADDFCIEFGVDGTEPITLNLEDFRAAYVALNGKDDTSV